MSEQYDAIQPFGEEAPEVSAVASEIWSCVLVFQAKETALLFP